MIEASIAHIKCITRTLAFDYNYLFLLLLFLFAGYPFTIIIIFIIISILMAWHAHRRGFVLLFLFLFDLKLLRNEKKLKWKKILFSLPRSPRASVHVSPIYNHFFSISFFGALRCSNINVRPTTATIARSLAQAHTTKQKNAVRKMVLNV